MVTGPNASPAPRAPRTEVGFVKHVARTVATDPEAEWILVCDQLNTHWSEGLVRVVAEKCKLKEDLGVKGRRGVSRSKETRQAFLEDKSRRIRCAYTPRHTSWLHQIEIWFSILARRVLRRGSFRGVDDPRERLLAFIAYFNRALAKSFKWTYTGRPLNI